MIHRGDGIRKAIKRWISNWTIVGIRCVCKTVNRVYNMITAKIDIV